MDFLGSSPLARGLPPPLVHDFRITGIIPARAGFTIVDQIKPALTEDHPRSRGVYSISVPTDSLLGGSSPLARGLHQVRVPEIDVVRIIPARAGFTQPRPPGPDSRADHPRSRGVYVLEKPLRGFRDGSSPLARGLLPSLAKSVYLLRIIPARAGFTPRTW